MLLGYNEKRKQGVAMFDRRGALISFSTAIVASALLSVVRSAGARAVEMDGVPLPNNVAIVPPAKSLSPSMSAFSGAWKGRWEDTLPHILAVEEINDGGAFCVYAWGEAKDWGIEPGWTRKRGQLSDGHLFLDLSYGGRRVTADYDQRDDGKLDAVYKAPGILSRATMSAFEI